ncbi:MAG: hypothetical protein HDT41_00460 [Lachnospiraceae bacterium]|nr:hypothetical protein [Lachnospiraceae bacterium]
MKKYLGILILVFCFSSSGTALAAEPDEDLVIKSPCQIFWSGIFSHNSLGDIPARYVKGIPDGADLTSYDMYACYKHETIDVTNDSDIPVGFLFVTDVPDLQNAGYYLTVRYDSGWINYGGYRKANFKKASELFKYYDNNNTGSGGSADYWFPYLEQFGIVSENMDEFREWCDSHYVAWIDSKWNLYKIQSDSLPDLPILELTESPNEVDGDRISTLRTFNEVTGAGAVWLNPGYYSEHYYTPFVYKNLVKKPFSSGDFPAENAKDFICYRRHIKPVASFSNTRVGSSCFTWKVEDYPEFANCYIEIRSTLLEGNQQFGYKLLTNDYYYYSSLDSSNKKPTQIRPLLKIPFTQGSTTCAESAMYDYYKTIDEFKNIAISCPVRFQVRVVSEDKTIYSNWVTFDFGVDGQNGWTGTMSDDGEIITDGINNLPDYDWDSDENSGKYGYESNGSSDSTNITDFSGWLKNALGTVISFPTLLATCYAWLPSDIIRLIGVSLGLLVVLRILGR